MVCPDHNDNGISWDASTAGLSTLSPGAGGHRYQYGGRFRHPKLADSPISRRNGLTYAGDCTERRHSMTVADEYFGQPRVHTHWPGAVLPIRPDKESSIRPHIRLIYVNENRVGPPTIQQKTDNIVDLPSNFEYTGFLPLSMIDYNVSQIQGNSIAPTTIWARITPIVRSALVCGVLALALVSIMCLVAGMPVIPGWIQGLFAMGGVAAGATIGFVRGPAA